MNKTSRYLLSAGLGLWALMMALQPNVGFTAPWPWMALFWALQIGSGLAVLQLVLYTLSRAEPASRMPLWALVMISGVFGSAVLTPVYWLIGEGLMEHTLAFKATTDDGHDQRSALAFGWPALLAEFSEIVGPITCSWALISWPRLSGLVPPLLIQPQAGSRVAPLAPTLESAPHSSWRAALPVALGDDLIAVTSELQYLRVWTTRGCALVLGSLQDVEDTEGVAGLRVHRSWWVHSRHVRSVRRSGAGAVCELSDGREVPVSRRRKTEVLARFGDGARYEVPDAARASSPDRVDQKTRRSPT
jgi:hypothetical protein